MTMTMQPRFVLLACLAIAPLMVACDADRSPATSQPASPSSSPSANQPADNEPRTALGRRIDEALREAREEIATENISVGGDMDIHVGGANIRRRKPRDADGNPLPEAEISPAGDLLIAGRNVDVTPDQRELLLDYRGHVVSMIEGGMAIGVKGADLGMEALGEALKGVFTGQTTDFEQHVEAESAKLEAEAMQMCDRLPAMLDSQRQLAEALPEFRPYATLAAEDIEDCRSDDEDNAAARAEAQAEVRSTIRSTIRKTVQTAAQTTGLAEAGTPDTSAPAAEATAP